MARSFCVWKCGPEPTLENMLVVGATDPLLALLLNKHP